MPTLTLKVPPIHCALCRARLVDAVQALGARVLGAVIGSPDLVVDTTDDAVLEAALTAVRAIGHDV